jgi:hypothetical protein
MFWPLICLRESAWLQQDVGWLPQVWMYPVHPCRVKKRQSHTLYTWYISYKLAPISHKCHFWQGDVDEDVPDIDL